MVGSEACYETKDFYSDGDEQDYVCPVCYELITNRKVEAEQFLQGVK